MWMDLNLQKPPAQLTGRRLSWVHMHHSGSEAAQKRGLNNVKNTPEYCFRIGPRKRVMAFFRGLRYGLALRMRIS